MYGRWIVIHMRLPGVRGVIFPLSASDEEKKARGALHFAPRVIFVCTKAGDKCPPRPKFNWLSKNIQFIILRATFHFFYERLKFLNIEFFVIFFHQCISGLALHQQFQKFKRSGVFFYPQLKQKSFSHFLRSSQPNQFASTAWLMKQLSLLFLQ